MRRRLAAVLAVFLAVPALALAAHTEPQRRIDPADQRKASSIVLKRSDFAAGWKKVSSSQDDDTHLNCPGYNPNESDLVLTGDAEAEFEAAGGFPAVLSASNVYRTRANALASWARGVKPALAVCLAKVLKETIEADGAQVAIVRQGKIAFPKLAPRTAAFRVTMKVSFTENGQTRSVPLTMYVIALGNGRGDAGLMTMAFGDSSRVSDVRVFARLLAQRLAAAKL